MNVRLAAALVLVMALSSPVIARPTSKQIRWASQTQGEAFRYGPYPHVLSGGWGAGKTWVACQKALWLSETYPKNRGVIARHVGKDLRATTVATFFKVCPPHLYNRRAGGRRSDQHGYLKLAGSQSEILFLHLDDPETMGVLRGLEINWFLIDQAEENPEGMEEIFDLLLGRLSRWDIAEVPQWMVDREEAQTGKPWPFRHPESDKPVPPPYAILACNPDQETHWLYRRFHPESHEHQELYAPRKYKMFHMPSSENQFLGDTNMQFLLAHDEAFISRNVRGEWGMPEGAIHLVPKLSLIPGDPDIVEHLLRTCLLFRTMDHGDSSPTCCVWWGVDRDGNVFAIREYYQPNRIISVHRQNIYDLSPKNERYELDLADPSIFHQMPTKQGGRWKVSDEYAEILEQPRETAIFWQAADNNELGTRNRINEYLTVDPERIHPITKEPGAPRLFFVQISDQHPQGVYHALRETRAQRRVKIGTDLGKPIFSDERDPTIVDHGYDPVRYFIASRAPVPAGVKRASDGTFFGAQQRLAALNRKRMGIR